MWIEVFFIKIKKIIKKNPVTNYTDICSLFDLVTFVYQMLRVDGVKCWAEVQEQHTRRCSSRCGDGRGPDGGLRKQHPLSGVCVFMS